MPLWKPAAIADRKRITQYIAKDNPRAAIEMGDMLMQKAEQLDQHPALGRVGRVKGTRELVAHPNYILIYRIVAKVPEVLCVKHAAQKWP
ncbi:type II toxin-antitoxin system RelE/ParE family toxin [Collimonas sp.]|uniref:type II toxin-antitoxin system RelE/ParE family toxin n=1 Tax=Collimonas sp. TaxID=1963772 RepID=UPI0037C038BD